MTRCASYLTADYLHWLSESAFIADSFLPAQQALKACLRLAATGERSALSHICTLPSYLRPQHRLVWAQPQRSGSATCAVFLKICQSHVV
jgi:hypothetical protein